MTDRRGLALPRRDWLLIGAGAALLTLAYPPFHLILPSFVCLIPVVWLMLDAADDPRPLRRRVVQGFWYGLLSQGLVLSWMIVALWHFTPLSALGYAATVLILAVYTAVLFGATGEIVRRTRLSYVVVLPFLWTALEWWVGHQGDIRFPWLGLGTSLTGYPAMVQIADIVGARGVTFLLVIANTLLAMAWVERRRARAWRRLAVVVGGVLACLAYGVVREKTLAVRTLGRVVLVQPNVGYHEKWDARLQDTIFSDLLSLSRRGLDEDDPAMVIWPEAAVPGSLPSPRWELPIGLLARAHHTPFLVGAVHYQSIDAYWNAAFLFDSTGSDRGYPVYHKRYLVPITERVPFVNPRWFHLTFFGGFAVGDLGATYQVGMGRFGVIICYESAFEDLTRRYRAMGADFVVNITNDMWFGKTAGPYQHLAHLVMRAIENRVGIPRAANTGISAVVDPFGRIHDRTRLGEQTVEVVPVETTDARTLYTRLGDWVGLLSLVGTGTLLVFAWWRGR